MRKRQESEFNQLMEEFSQLQSDEGIPVGYEDIATGEYWDGTQWVPKYQQPGFVSEEEFDEYINSKPGEPTSKYTVDKAVDSPSHYHFIDTTVNDLIKKAFTHCEYMGWLKGNVIKYRMRAFKKNKLGSQDIAKADEYESIYKEYVKENTQ